MHTGAPCPSPDKDHELALFDPNRYALSAVLITLSKLGSPPVRALQVKGLSARGDLPMRLVVHWLLIRGHRWHS